MAAADYGRNGRKAVIRERRLTCKTVIATLHPENRGRLDADQAIASMEQAGPRAELVRHYHRLRNCCCGRFSRNPAANWNDLRKERAEERRYYAQIIDDLRVDQATLQESLQRSNALDAAAENTLRAMRDGIPPDITPVQFARNIHYAGYLYIPPTVRRTYDELVSTGNLGLLESEKAKAAIASYYSRFDELRQWDELMRSQQGRYWAATAGVLPRHVLREVVEERTVTVSDGEANAMLAELRGRDQIDDMLIGMAAHQARVRRDSVDLAERCQALINELGPLASR